MNPEDLHKIQNFYGDEAKSEILDLYLFDPPAALDLLNAALHPAVLILKSKLDKSAA
jgi:hypothetical protein